VRVKPVDVVSCARERRRSRTPRAEIQ
jgi:hypothetical protein